MSVNLYQTTRRNKTDDRRLGAFSAFVHYECQSANLIIIITSEHENGLLYAELKSERISKLKFTHSGRVWGADNVSCEIIGLQELWL
jgi:hypothetical protein